MALVKAWLTSAPRWLDALLMAMSVPLAWLQRFRGPGNGVALVYHRLAPEAGDASRELLPAIAVEDFERQLRLARRRYRLVPASTLLSAAWSRRRGARLPLAITFDDDDPGHLRWAAPALRAAGTPATFYLCGGSLDAPRTYWWERLERLGDAGIHATAARVEAMPAPDRTAFDRGLGERLGPEPPDAGLRAADVARLAADFEIGFHTREHHPLNTLTDDELAAALRDSRDELAAAASQPLATIAYPHGRADARTAPAVAAAGFTAGFTTAGHPLRPGTDPHLIGRLEPRSPSLAVFALKLAVAHLRR
jgi:peptidoglycan/xylan/chitin deacetylase (PgdA/CDA1 family)